MKEFVSRLLTAAKQAAGPSPIDEALEQAKTAFEADDAATAGSIYGQILQQDPGNLAALAGMGRCYLATGQIDAARQLADSLPEEAAGDPDVTAFKSSLELADQAQGAAGEIPELEAKIAADPNDHQSRFDLALAQYGQGANEAAIDTLLEILSRKRDWNENAAREQLVKIFEALGGSHPDTIAGRQKMASILFA